MQPLPPSLGDRFSVAAARSAGVQTSRLRRTDLVRPFHGVRERRDLLREAEDVTDRHGMPRGDLELAHLRTARRYAERMSPHEAFSHVTAAVIWDIPLPVGILRDPRVHVSVESPRRLSRSVGVRGHQIVAGRLTLIREPATGVLVTDPASTWVTLAACLRSNRDLIAAGDAIIRTWRVRHPLATVDDLTATAARGRSVGIGALRAALPLLRTAAASRPESHLRIALLEAGLPEPELNRAFSIADRIVTADLVYPDARVAVEYEGDHHRLDADQWTYDIDRYDALRRAGWEVVRITRTDVFGDRPRAAAKVAAALRSAR